MRIRIQNALRSLPIATPKPPAKPLKLVAPPAGIEFNADFRRALDLIHVQRQSALITGRAGTGKSTLLRYFRAANPQSVVVLAPTGIAAVNVGGQTIHSFFKFPPRLIEPRDIRDAKPISGLRRLQTLVIEEVSMVRADLLDGIDLSLRLNRGDNRPFGGVQVVMFGDPLQLPPIVREDGLKQYFADHYGTPYFFSARVFERCPIPLIELQKVYRQKDGRFLEALNRVREGTNIEEALELLNSRVHETVSVSGDAEITLTTTNARARAINQARLDAIQSEPKVYKAEVTGMFQASAYPTDRVLVLKRGARVMLVRNDSENRWVNGSLGTVEELRESSAIVRVNGVCHEVAPELWESVRYAYDRKKGRVAPTAVGEFEQLPLRVAYAVTIHKSQGQTFDQVVIDMDRGAFAPGQLYVALSRCRTLEGIRLVRPIDASDVIVDPRAREYRERFIG